MSVMSEEEKDEDRGGDVCLHISLLMYRIRKSTLDHTFIKILSLQLTVLVLCRGCSPRARFGIPYWILQKNGILIRSWGIKHVV